MSAKVFLIGAIVTCAVALGLSATGDSIAMMGGNVGGGMGGGASGHYQGGRGYGMSGGASMMPAIRGATMSQGYLKSLNPVETHQEALAALEGFLNATQSGLKVSELWEYETAYKAELSDVDGEKAFDLLVDKFTGAVLPEMGFSMMMNASWGRALQRTPRFGRTLRLPQEEATAAAQAFVDENGLGYKLQPPETYPGFYKFHTLDPAAQGGVGMDIMVSGYDGGIWMETLLGLPLGPPVIY